MEDMAIFQQVREQVTTQPPGTLLVLGDFGVPPEHAQALTQSLSRLYKEGILRRIMKGLYYKPAMGVIGEIFPSSDKILKKLLAVYKENISYVTGANVYTELGLTTQVSKEYVIASDKPRTPVKLGTVEVRFIRSHVTEAVQDPTPLQILDAIWEIEEIPATNPTDAAQGILGQIRALQSDSRKALARFALSYPPKTRAITGLLLETLGDRELARTLKSSLKSTTTFKIPLNGEVFTNKRAWNIL